MAKQASNQPAKKTGGRKKLPAKEKKLQFTLYVESYKIDKLGGMESAQEKVMEFIDREIDNIN